MNKVKSISLVLALLLAISLLLSGCGLLKSTYEGKSKIFTSENVEITLTDSFYEQDDEGYYEFFYYSSTAGVICNSEKKSELLGTTAWTLEKYAELTRESLDSDMTSQDVCTIDGLVVLECSWVDEDGDEWTYFLTFFETEGYFWTVQFHCLSEEYEVHKPYFVEWAKTVKFI